jgi:hypothetical protein
MQGDPPRILLVVIAREPNAVRWWGRDRAQEGREEFPC